MTDYYTEDGPPMLFKRRRQLALIERAEAKGRSFWTESLDEKVRQKLFYQVQDLTLLLRSISFPGNFDFLAKAQRHVLRDTGLPCLSKSYRYDPIEDALNSILEAEEDIVFSLIEAIISLPKQAESVPISPNHLSKDEANQLNFSLPNFIDKIRIILREHRISYDLVGGKFLPLESLVMHEKVVVPTLTFLGSNKEFTNAETAYLKALDELHKGSPDKAITDAAVALEEALSALGCEGNSLGSLANSAMKRDIILSYDKKFINWVAADRSTKGGTHTVSSASTEDAWLTVHVVGAIILRITSGPLRSEAAQ